MDHLYHGNCSLRVPTSFVTKMLGVFEKSKGKQPKELNVPSVQRPESIKTREDIAQYYLTWRKDSDTTLYNFPNGNFMALSQKDECPPQPRFVHYVEISTIFSNLGRLLLRWSDIFPCFACITIRSVVVMDDIFCIFFGALDNHTDMRRFYGLQSRATEAMILHAAYTVLRDRAPYPPDQVIKEFQGQYAFMLFDAKYSVLFLGRVSWSDSLLLHHIVHWLSIDCASNLVNCCYIVLIPNVVCFNVILLYSYEWSVQHICQYLVDFFNNRRVKDLECTFLWILVGCALRMKGAECNCLRPVNFDIAMNCLRTAREAWNFTGELLVMDH